MKYPKILSQDLMLITAAGFARIIRDFEGRQQPGEHGEIWTPTEPADDPTDQMEIVDGVAIIPVKGPISKDLGEWEKLYGMVDVNDLDAMLEDAEGNPAVESILYDIDSPGGIVQGVVEHADRILQSDKPVWAYTGGCAASMAYWLAMCSSEGILATRTADAGCIGVFNVHVDRSEALRQAGIKVQVFNSGEYKGMGIFGTTLTKKQAAMLQSRADELGTMFRDCVRMQRDEVQDDDMEGQLFSGKTALEKGFVDEIVTSRDHALEIMRG